MPRSLQTLAIATLMTCGLFAQTFGQQIGQDPVAELTNRIISQYLPTARATTSASYGNLTAAPVMTFDSYGGMRLPQFETYGMSGIGMSGIRMQGLGYPPAFNGGFTNPLPMYHGLYRPSVPFFTPYVPAMPYSLPLIPNRLPAENDLLLPMATPRPTIAEQRPLSMSVASTNGVYAIQAVVPTESGQERVNLSGTTDEVKTQLNDLSPKTQRMMRRSLGL